MTRKLMIGALAAALVALTGCAGSGSQGGQPTALVNSGFLPDYSLLKPVDGVEGSYRYIEPGVNLRPYQKVMIDPVKLILAPGADTADVSPEVMQALANAFRMEFVGAVLPYYNADIGQEMGGYTVVGRPGPDVIRVRLAITGIQPARPDLTASDLIPIKAIYNVARDAAGEAPHVAELTAEVEVIDPSGRMVAEAVATRKGDKTLAQGERITWKDMHGIVASWAKRFRQNLDLLRNYAGE